MHVWFGAPKAGCYDQGLFSNFHLVVSEVSMVFVVPRNTGIVSINRGVCFQSFSWRSVVFVVSSLKKEQPPC